MRDSLWQAVLGEIELLVSRGSFVTWFKSTRLLGHRDNVLTIGVPNVFVKQQLERKFDDLVKKTLQKNGVVPDRIEYKIHSLASPAKKEQAGSLVLDAPAINKSPARPHPSSNGLRHAYRQGLNERYTFDNFVVGSANELAYAACQGVASAPGAKYNPLFIYGGVGVGKTHLIQAVGNALLAKNPNARVVYISTEQFVQEFLDAIRFKKNTDFAGYYRGADVLVVDDIQFIAGKEKTQDEFFHTFNALHQANKQIIISCDRPPQDIPTLEERLRSRFAWGMAIDMQTPDFETRCAIVQTKAVGHGFTLPVDVVEYLANLVQTNIRELEGALNQLLALCEMRGLAPDIEIARAMLNISQARPKHISARQVVEKTARYFKVPLEDILGPKRDRDVVVPRQIAMYILRSELHLSFPKIARELGRKDHTTALHSVNKISREVSCSGATKTAIAAIRERLYV